MGSTFVNFRGRGFEASDSALEIWLLLLVEAIDGLPILPDWLKAAREEWYIQATEAFGFGVVPGLDQIVISSERREVILGLCSKAARRLQAYGSTIPMDELNLILRANEKRHFTADARTRHFEKTGQFFIKLLREELTPEESDARF